MASFAASDRGGGGIEDLNINSVLQSLAPSDAQHDFGSDKPTTPEQQQAYNTGLYKVDPKSPLQFKTESESLMSVVKTPANYIPIEIANPTKDFCHASSHNIETNNGKNYAVKYADVKWKKSAIEKYIESKTAFETEKTAINAEKNANIKKASDVKKQIEELKKKEKGFIESLKEKINKIKETFNEEKPEVDREEITAPMFYELMNIDVNQTIAIVVDAASIAIVEILSRGKFTGTRPTVYYIYGPEVEHDPATKKHPASSDFKNPDTWLEGVKFIPCVSLNPASFVYSYSYMPDDPSGLYLNQFFTNFQFELSELRTTPKGKTVEYSTDLTIKAFDATDTINRKLKFIDESVDSKSKSDITFLTKIIEALKSTLKSGNEKEFQYAISFLKKMSGDWLQVLLTRAVADRTRGFTPYGKPRENVTGKIDRVFFVTHDQIALSFALLMGVECLFTHHGAVAGNPSLHSAFLFSLANEADINASLIAKAEKVSANYSDKMSANYSDKINSLEKSLTTYNSNYNTAISGLEIEMNSYLDGYLKSMDDRLADREKTMLVSNFDKYVQNIFSLALKMVATKKLLPSLKDDTISIATLKTSNTTLQSKIVAFAEAAKRPTLPKGVSEGVSKDPTLPKGVSEAAKELLELDGKIESEIKNVEKIVSAANDLFDITTSEKTRMNLKDKIAEFTKTLIYSAANKWTWDSSEVSSRALSKLTNYNETKAFNADRNIFIYHLDALDDVFKQKITNLFAKCYSYISKGKTKFTTNEIKKKNNTEIPLTDYQFQKYKVMAETFCYEVFLNFGTFGKDAGATPEIVMAYSDSIIAANDLLILWDDITNEEYTYKKELLCPNHLDESVLVKQMNEIGGALDDKVESFTQAEPESTQAEPKSTQKKATPLKKQSSFSMTFNSVNTACKLLTHRLFSTPVRSDGGGGIAGGGKYPPHNQKSSKIALLPFMRGGGASPSNFHYLLPIEILLFQLLQTLRNENYKESLDFQLALQFYDFLLTIKEKAMLIDEKDSYKIGLGIRDMFFIKNDVVSSKFPGKVVSFVNMLVTRFCGVLNDDVKPNMAIITGPVFDTFMTEIINNHCFETQYDLIIDTIVYDDFIEAVSQTTKEVALKIIGDRELPKLQDLEPLIKMQPSENVFLMNSMTRQIKSHGGRRSRRNKKTRRNKKSTHKKSIRKI